MGIKSLPDSRVLISYKGATYYSSIGNCFNADEPNQIKSNVIKRVISTNWPLTVNLRCLISVKYLCVERLSNRSHEPHACLGILFHYFHNWTKMKGLKLFYVGLLGVKSYVVLLFESVKRLAGNSWILLFNVYVFCWTDFKILKQTFIGFLSHSLQTRNSDEYQ